MLKSNILKKTGGYLFYGLTPPKENTPPERVQAIAQKQIERLKGIELDGLVLYDIQDESSRTDAPRPFPYLSTLSPDEYSVNYLQGLKVPKIIYRSIGKYNESTFEKWLLDNTNTIDYTVFVGSPSKNQANQLSLQDAYRIKRKTASPALLGGVTIPERHAVKGDEHQRVFGKIDNGCNFFVSQCVYSLDNSKNFLSDYYYASIKSGRELVPIIFTLTPCGSVKTLQFMEWLGIDIPRWLNNELKHSKNILSKSIEACKNIAQELLDFSAQKNIPIGFNVESVAIRKEEIEASIQLLRDIKAMQHQQK